MWVCQHHIFGWPYPNSGKDFFCIEHDSVYGNQIIGYKPQKSELGQVIGFSGNCLVFGQNIKLNFEIGTKQECQF